MGIENWAIGLLVAGGLACGAARNQEATPERRAEVRERGARVMPFDLSRTTHVFQDLPDGGLQTVRADQPGDTLQIRLIREHLREETGRFTRGDFDDPMAIHGHAMPGLAELRRGYRSFTAEYGDTIAGARIRYRSADPALIEALHRWFAAQRSDHGG